MTRCGMVFGITGKIAPDQVDRRSLLIITEVVVGRSFCPSISASYSRFRLSRSLYSRSLPGGQGNL